MTGDKKGLVSFYLQSFSFFGDRKWPETENGQRRGVAREKNALEKKMR
jgi:hypothetical protein